MKRELQLDPSRLLGFKLMSKDDVTASRQPRDPRIGAKIGKGPDLGTDPRIGVEIGKPTQSWDPRIGAKIGKGPNAPAAR